MILKCKPTWQFQSVEFDWEIVDGVDFEAQVITMFKTYDKVLKGLQKIAPVQDQKNQKPAEPLATQRQKDTMDLYGIDYPDNITSKQAQALIQRSMSKG